MAEKVNVSWPGWNVDRFIGRGSFGSVYEISRDIFGSVERSALKVISIPRSEDELEELRSEGYDKTSLTSHFRSYLEEIAREYSLMVRMKGHPNIVYCDDFRDIPHADGIGWDIYIKMELLTPLVRIMPAHYSESLTVQLGRGICNALVMCEKRNILHRDIKPENVFLSRTGDFKLGDFGVAKVAQKVAFGTKIGTYDYMAPEVYTNKPYSFPCDQYSLGMMLYWTMNDRRIPFLPQNGQIPTASEKEAARKRRMDGEPLPPPLHGSPALKSLVLKACAYDPADRFAGAEEMLAALQRIEAAPLDVDALLASKTEGKGMASGSGKRPAPPSADLTPRKQPASFTGNTGLYRAPASLDDL